ncbi:MAG: BON domain-containing protein [Acidobacteriota bacterium]
MKRITRVLTMLLALSLLGTAALVAGDKKQMLSPQERLHQEVFHQLVTLPYYGVFDDLSYSVEGDTVTLMGQVTRPTLKTDAERRVMKIEGVDKVVNQIEVLPLSPNDDRIRLAVYRAIYSKPGLDQYALRAVPPLHIIVKNGNVTLTGFVSREGDKNQAGIVANGVSGVFGVTNNLQVDKN